MYGSTYYGGVEYGGLGTNGPTVTSVSLVEHGHMLDSLTKEITKAFVEIFSTADFIAVLFIKQLYETFHVTTSFIVVLAKNLIEHVAINTFLFPVFLKVFFEHIIISTGFLVAFTKNLFETFTTSVSITRKNFKTVVEAFSVRLSMFIPGRLIDLSESFRVASSAVRLVKKMVQNSVIGSDLGVQFFFQKFFNEHASVVSAIIKRVQKNLSEVFLVGVDASKLVKKIIIGHLGASTSLVEGKLYNRFPFEHVTLVSGISKGVGKSLKEAATIGIYFRIGGKTIELFFREAVKIHHNSLNSLIYFIRTHLAVFRPRGGINPGTPRGPGDPNSF